MLEEYYCLILTPKHIPKLRYVHYPSFTILKNIQNKVTYPHTIAYREINETNLNNFNDSLSTVDWTPVLSKVTSNDAYETFFKYIQRAYEYPYAYKNKTI